MKRSKRKRTIRQCACPACDQHPYSALAQEHSALNRVLATLDEKEHRRVVGILALKPKHGNLQRLVDITGLGRNTILKGRREVCRGEVTGLRGRTRRAGGGRLTVEKNTRSS